MRLVETFADAKNAIVAFLATTRVAPIDERGSTVLLCTRGVWRRHAILHITQCVSRVQRV